MTKFEIEVSCIKGVLVGFGLDNITAVKYYNWVFVLNSLIKALSPMGTNALLLRS